MGNTRCTRCIMPDSVPGITFNEQGVCSFCREYRDISLQGTDVFDSIINEAKGKKAPYDCVVPLSGGRDSTYLLYMARVVYGLKVLAVNYDNEFRADQALVNMQTACEKLGIEFLSIRSRWSLSSKIAKFNLRSSVNPDRFGVCTACVYGYRSIVYRTALKHRIPLILWGESSQEATEDMEKLAFWGLSANKSRFRKMLNVNFYLSELCKILQHIEFRVPGNSVFFRGEPILNDPFIKEVRVFDYINWDREAIKETITTKLGWRKPKNSHTTWRTDCLMHPFVNYSFLRLLGCSKDCFGYNKMINSGKMEREEALVQETHLQEMLGDDVYEQLQNLCGMNKNDVKRIEALFLENQVDKNFPNGSSVA